MFVIPFALAYLCSYFLVQVMLIQGDSMLPAYHDKQFVLLNKCGKVFARGDVIAFSCEALQCNLVKRIVGEPGDMIVLENGFLYLNGEVFLKLNMDEQGQENSVGIRKEFIVPENSYYVIGDNASQSVDSRDPSVGFVSRDQIIGKIWK